METEFKTFENSQQRVLVYGNSSLADAVAAEFVKNGIATVMYDASRSEQSQIEFEGASWKNLGVDAGKDPAGIMDAAASAIGEITSVVNVHVPHGSDAGQKVVSYASQLMDWCSYAADRMATKHGLGCIVNHCVLPAMYAGTDLEDHVSILRGAVTGVTRSIARRYGKRGIRCIGVQTGMIEMPEAAQWVCEKVKSIPMPMKRWGNSNDLAKLVSFLALDASYITGQTIILDGGLTAGVTGT